MSYTIKINDTEIQNNLVNMNISPKDPGQLQLSISGNPHIGVSYDSSAKKVWSFDLRNIDGTLKDIVLSALNSLEPIDFTPPGSSTSVSCISTGLMASQIYPYSSDTFTISGISIMEI